jgi:uncharacterized phage protein (TIGR02216 family)
MNWALLYYRALRELGLRPDDFWSLTPAQLQLLLGPPPRGQARCSAADLAALMQAFPDTLNDGGMNAL